MAKRAKEQSMVGGCFAPSCRGRDGGQDLAVDGLILEEILLLRLHLDGAND